MESIYYDIEKKLAKISDDYNCSLSAKSKNVHKCLKKWEEDSKTAVDYVKSICFCLKTYTWHPSIAPTYREAFFLALEISTKDEKDRLMFSIISNRHPKDLREMIKIVNVSILIRILNELISHNAKLYDEAIINLINLRPDILFYLSSYEINKLNLDSANALFLNNSEKPNIFFDNLDSSSKIRNLSDLLNENPNFRTAFNASLRIKEQWMFLTKRDAKLATNFEDAFIVFNNASNKWQKELTNLKWLLDFVNNSEQSLKLTNKFISFGHESFYYSVAIILHERMVRKELAEGVSPEKLFKQNYSISNLKISDLNEEIIEKFLS